MPARHIRPRDSSPHASSSPAPRISVAVMHHPRRGSGVVRLVEACRPLTARVVADPEPSGPPSPLRTAKVAWADIAPGATHHLVLQDDVTPCPDFARQLTAAVAERPDDALALYTNWNSPHNSYLVRCAAVAGQSWAPLGHHEWVPTLGLVLPADAARRLAAYLAAFPDDVRDDDELVVRFCAQEGRPVTATVPHLLEHGSGPSVAGNGAHGPRHATVPAGTSPPPQNHWRRPGPRTFPPRTGAPHEAYAVELRDSRCSLRLLRPEAGEPLEHPFGWDWADWAHLVGVDPARVRRDLVVLERGAGRGGPLRGPVLAETAAAAWLLGYDVARTDWPMPPGPARTGDRSEALKSWIRSGLAPDDRVALGPQALRALARQAEDALDLGLSAGSSAAGPHFAKARSPRPAKDAADRRGAADAGAAAAGIRSSTGTRPSTGTGNSTGTEGFDDTEDLARSTPAHRRGHSVPPAVRDAVADLAVREAAVLTNAAMAAPLTGVLVRPCPGCGARPDESVLRTLRSRHTADGALTYHPADREAPNPDLAVARAHDEGWQAVLELLACERPTTRGLAALAHGTGAHRPTLYRTRGAALLRLRRGDRAPSPDDLPELAAREADWWDSAAWTRAHGTGILPISCTAADSRPGPSTFVACRAADSPMWRELADLYRTVRLDTVGRKL